MEELISVIVPVHNAEAYLDECIQSIIKQTYKNMEIILIDDCSVDKSAQICDNYAQKDDRIKVFHRKTKGGEGGAVARNQGINQATGDLLYFLDSDDYIEEDMLENMHALMKKEKSQCVVTSFHYVDAGGTELSWRTPRVSAYHCMEGGEAARVFLTTLDIEGFSWNKLISKELIDRENICFDEGMNSFVDMLAMFKVVLFSEKVSFYHARPYYYRQHEVSCVHTMTQRKLNNFRRVVTQIAELAEANGMNDEGSFFYSYRMLMQLFDAIKAKSSYDAQVWKQITEGFCWKIIFGQTLPQIIKQIFSYCNESRVKTAIKILAVWLNFR